MPGSVELTYQDPIPWDGTPIDMTPFGYITIWVFENPTTSYTVNCGIQNNLIPQGIMFNGNQQSFQKTFIDAAGRYTVPGNCWVSVTGGAGGGQLYISAGQCTFSMLSN